MAAAGLGLVVSAVAAFGWVEADSGVAVFEWVALDSVVRPSVVRELASGVGQEYIAEQ